MTKSNISFVFFGTPDFAVKVLDTLEAEGFLPTLVVTQEDKPQGRHLTITPPPTKIWAEKRNIPILQPKTLKDEAVLEALKNTPADVFVVASYGKIIPKNILEIPPHKTLNIHPSLLPKYRGASPIQEAIIKDTKTGVTIIRLDEEMDHGPIIAQKEAVFSDWPPYLDEARMTLAEVGGKLLAEILPDWILGKIEEAPQDHTQATFTKKIEKTDAEIDLKDDPEINLRKIRAYRGSPNAYTFVERHGKKIRLIIKEADIENGALVLKRIIPEGKREMTFEEFERGHTTD
jgi:methionyl-tRNA formyltransferase